MSSTPDAAVMPATVGADEVVERAMACVSADVSTERRDVLRAMLVELVACGHLDTVVNVAQTLPFEGCAMLEVGCGAPWRAPFFLALGASRYEGIEPFYEAGWHAAADLGTSFKCHSNDRDYREMPLTIGEFLASFDGVAVHDCDLEEAPVGPGAFDVLCALTVTEHFDDPEGAVACMARMLRPGGRALIVHGNYYCWNGHHLRPQSVAEFDPSDPDHQAIVDWGHVFRFVGARQIETLNYIRIHELFELLKRHFVVDAWRGIESAPEYGGGRLTDEIRRRLPEYSTEELLTEVVECCLTKPDAPPPPPPRERVVRKRRHRIETDDAGVASIELLWSVTDTGLAYSTAIPDLESQRAAGAVFSLWEDDAELGPGDALHADIRAEGGGRFSIWGETLYYSSSDGSDPWTNGRRYVLRREDSRR